MPSRLKRMIAAALLMAILLTGCWDMREILDYHIITGIAADTTAHPDLIDISLQVANIKQEASNSENGGSGESGAAILLKTVSDSFSEGIIQINRNSNHNLLFQHNQIRLLGIDLAEKGITKYLDLLLRESQSRLEVPLVVVDGRAEEALSAKLPQEEISGIFLGGMFRDQAAMSIKYRVRLIDFVHVLLDDAAAPVIPIIKVTGEEEKKELKLDGMAVFENGKMIGRLTDEETMGFVWSFGDVQKSSLQVRDGTNAVVFLINKLDCKRAVTLRPDGGVKVALNVDTQLVINELYGFKDLDPLELVERLKTLAQDEIEKKITDSFKAAQRLNADVFGFCTEVYRKHPKKWKDMKDKWDQLFSEIEFSVQAKVHIAGTGQIVQSLEKEEGEQ